MKGRRPARRSALQALYELDQSDHSLEEVLAGRVRALREAALDSMLPSALRALGRQVLSNWEDGVLAEAATRALAVQLGAGEAEVAAVARVLNQVAPQAAYLVAIVRGVMRHRDVLDEAIHKIAPEWPVAQMAPVDRNILRIALWELGTGASPTRVAISEAVELARAFSGEGARRMVNGALGTYVARGMRLDLAPDAHG